MSEIVVKGAICVRSLTRTLDTGGYLSTRSFKGIPGTKKLGDRDSNPDTTVQSRMSYHWTIAQYKNNVGSLTPDYSVGQKPPAEYIRSQSFVKRTVSRNLHVFSPRFAVNPAVSRHQHDSLDDK